MRPRDSYRARRRNLARTLHVASKDDPAGKPNWSKSWGRAQAHFYRTYHKWISRG